MEKPKSFRPWQPDQATLVPPSPREWLAEDHQVYFLMDLVKETFQLGFRCRSWLVGAGAHTGDWSSRGRTGQAFRARLTPEARRAGTK
jgi:hypothetical protein